MSVPYESCSTVPWRCHGSTTSTPTRRRRRSISRISHPSRLPRETRGEMLFARAKDELRGLAAVLSLVVAVEEADGTRER